MLTMELLRDRDEAAAVDEGIADIDAGRTHDLDDVLAHIGPRADVHGGG